MTYSLAHGLLHQWQISTKLQGLMTDQERAFRVVLERALADTVTKHEQSLSAAWAKVGSFYRVHDRL